MADKTYDAVWTYIGLVYQERETEVQAVANKVGVVVRFCRDKRYRQYLRLSVKTADEEVIRYFGKSLRDAIGVL